MLRPSAASGATSSLRIGNPSPVAYTHDHLARDCAGLSGVIGEPCTFAQHRRGAERRHDHGGAGRRAARRIAIPLPSGPSIRALIRMRSKTPEGDSGHLGILIDQRRRDCRGPCRACRRSRRCKSTMRSSIVTVAISPAVTVPSTETMPMALLDPWKATAARVSGFDVKMPGLAGTIVTATGVVAHHAAALLRPHICVDAGGVVHFPRDLRVDLRRRDEKQRRRDAVEVHGRAAEFRRQRGLARDPRSRICVVRSVPCDRDDRPGRDLAASAPPVRFVPSAVAVIVAVLDTVAE